MKIYTKTGDFGETGLLGGDRVRKDNPRIGAIGAVDELNAALGVAFALGLPADVESVLGRVQSDLFELGAELASSPAAGRRSPTAPVDIVPLEQAIDRVEEQLPTLKSFILPGGSLAAAQLHFARSVCRRAECCVVALADAESVAPTVLAYLNRLSDLLFVLARFVNMAENVTEIRWPSTDSKQ